MSDRQHDQTLIVGDFNFPRINWESHLSNTDEDPASQFLKLTDECFQTKMKMTDDILNLMNEKRKERKTEEHKKIENKIKSMCKKARVVYFQDPFY